MFVSEMQTESQAAETQVLAVYLQSAQCRQESYRGERSGGDYQQKNILRKM